MMGVGGLHRKERDLEKRLYLDSELRIEVCDDDE